MNWTVLGSKGVIGHSLVDHLISLGQIVYTPPRSLEGFFNRHLGHVIYAIGLTADFRQRPFDTVQAHVSLVADILQKGNFDSFLYLSSTRVYSRSDSGLEVSPLPTLTLDPSDFYNISKLMGEAICLQDIRKTVRVARLSNVVGGDAVDSANFVPSLIRDSLRGNILLKTALDSSKDYIHINDVSELLPRIALEGRERLYNVASGLHITHSQWACQIRLLTGCVIEVAPDAPTVSFVPIDISRIKSEFGFQPRPALEVLNMFLKFF